MKNKSKKNILVVAGMVMAIAGATIFANLTFIRRLMTYPEDPITNVDWYRPLATVSGNPRQIKRATTNAISQDSLSKVTNYAKNNQSSALLVMHQGELILEQYWQGFTSNSTFNSMSMSKTIAALLIGIAIAQGKIESELEPVANYIPKWSDDKRSNITIQDLLYMQSGLQNRDNRENPLSDLVRMYAGKDVNAVAIKIPAEKDPRRVFSYNNANTQILSQVLERATGESYADYLSRQLWQPLAARDAYLWLDRIGGNPKSFCCLFATAQDWAKVGQLFLDRGMVNGKRVVSSDWLDKMQRSSPIEPKYGYHLWLEARTKENSTADISASRPFLTQDTFYLDGASNQRVYIIPSQELVIVRVGEKPPQWDDAFIPNTLIANLQNK